MPDMNLLRFFFLLLIPVFSLRAELPLKPKEWMVDGVKRGALIYVPSEASAKPTPVVFAFHGHGGNMKNAARMFPIPELWPEALVVYMQGLNTPGRLTDPEGKKPGWQHGLGAEGDRDLKFFDAVLASLKADYQVDATRIYSTGHSNGGGFTYLLWAARGDVFAAMAPSAAASPGLMGKLKPKPVMHIAGENDPLVKYEWQQATIQAVVRLNQCGSGVAWDQDANCTFHPSKIGTPVVTAIHPGDHKFHKDAPALIVKFFKQYARKVP
ncbi:MAG TPA: esterase [Verrucomicrobiales bacterium]|nr:esterase [Verrucomicrobiales bacterium]